MNSRLDVTDLLGSMTLFDRTGLLGMPFNIVRMPSSRNVHMGLCPTFRNTSLSIFNVVLHSK